MDDGAKRLVIMRGLPWAGKSYRAKEIAGNLGVIFSTDEYWYKIVHPERPDEYSFNIRFLSDAHKWNLRRAQKAIEEAHPLIVIDNTNTTPGEPRPYVAYAVPQGYEVSVEEPTSERWQEIRQLLRDKRGNKAALKAWARELEDGSKETHSVPAWAIERMMWRWIPDLTVEMIMGKE